MAGRVSLASGGRAMQRLLRCWRTPRGSPRGRITAMRDATSTFLCTAVRKPTRARRYAASQAATAPRRHPPRLSVCLSVRLPACHCSTSGRKLTAHHCAFRCVFIYAPRAEGVSSLRRSAKRACYSRGLEGRPRRAGCAVPLGGWGRRNGVLPHERTRVDRQTPPSFLLPSTFLASYLSFVPRLLWQTIQRRNGLLIECFAYVCPEPVLVKCSFIYINCSKRQTFAMV